MFCHYYNYLKYNRLLDLVNKLNSAEKFPVYGNNPHKRYLYYCSEVMPKLHFIELHSNLFLLSLTDKTTEIKFFRSTI